MLGEGGGCRPSRIRLLLSSCCMGWFAPFPVLVLCSSLALTLSPCHTPSMIALWLHKPFKHHFYGHVVSLLGCFKDDAILATSGCSRRGYAAWLAEENLYSKFICSKVTQTVGVEQLSYCIIWACLVSALDVVGNILPSAQDF